MTTTFPRTDKKTLGYSREQVEAFLTLARDAYDAPESSWHGPTDVRSAALRDDVVRDDALNDDALNTVGHRSHPTRLTAQTIRHTAFAMQKGGYAPAQVDAALERLEDAFAAREREAAALELGEEAWVEQAQATAQVVLARIDRERGHRFARTSVFSVGYRRTDVDRFARRLQKYFNAGRSLTVDEVRTAVFRPERGGYREAQVDALLDSVIDVMLAMR